MALGIEERLDRLESADEIRNAIARYCFAVDAGDLDELGRLFHPDASVVRLGVTRNGQEDVLAFYQDYAESSIIEGRHYVVNPVITFDHPEQATVASVFFANMNLKGDLRLAWGHYLDVLVRTPEGWQFTEKHIEVEHFLVVKDGWPTGEQLTWET